MRLRSNSTATRPGSILPMLAVCLVAVFSFVALAIDLGMLMIARTESQNAADAAALSATRVLDNRYPANTDPADYDNRRADADTRAREVVVDNIFLNAKFTPDRVNRVRVGLYDYVSAANAFRPTYPSTKPPDKSWTCVEVVVIGDQPTYFGKVMGINTMPMTARAVAAHRPRDVAIVLDYSGSMMFSSNMHWEPGTANSNDVVYGLLNPDPNTPRFGHYSRYDAYQTTTPTRTLAISTNPADRPHPLRMTGHFLGGTNEVFSPNNHTIETPNGPPIVKDFWFDPSNIADASVPVTTVNPANLRNAFHRWRRLGDANGTPQFDPPVLSSGNPSSYAAPIYSWGNYNAFDQHNNVGPVPAPPSFATQADAGGVPYVGDRAPRRGGVVVTTGSNWDPTTPTGAARTALDLLYPAGTAPSPEVRAIPLTRPALANGNRTEGGPTWSQFRDDAWERHGYDMNIPLFISSASSAGTGPRRDAFTYFVGRFQGYSMGPGYFGKTFFQWPPDPRWGGENPTTRPDTLSPADDVRDFSGNYVADWRRRFFLPANSPDTGNPSSFIAFDPQADNDPTTPGTQNINQALLRPTPGHVLRDATTGATRNYRINYRAVLAWLKRGPQTLPPNLRAGRIVYYTSIPNHVDNALADPDQRFWREYIDYVLGYNGNTGAYDARFALAGVESFPWPENQGLSIGETNTFDPDGELPDPPNPRPYMNYTDSPNRPRMHFWFGPQTMLGFLTTRTPVRNWLPGTCHEAQGWQLKAGVQSGIEDIRANHPNDQVGLCFFAHPNYSTPRVNMGQDWASLRNALFYPRSLLGVLRSSPSTELRPYNAGFGSAQLGNLPNANGLTDPVSGFAQAYNMLSSSPAISGTGRRGAAKIVIFETDGVPNAFMNFSLMGTGPNSYYALTSPGGFVGNGDPSVMQRAYDAVSQIVAPVADGGFSLPNAPARVYPIAFGDLFSSTSGFRPTALNFLQNVAYLGQTSPNGNTPLPNQQVITGPYLNRVANLQTAFERILQSGVQVTLVE